VGVRVPDDISVIGFDNIFAADLITPGLTTVAAPLRTQGTTAARNLLAIIGGAKARGGAVVLPVKLVVRHSTGKRAAVARHPVTGRRR
jgi:LacI family transcriptional regulator